MLNSSLFLSRFVCSASILSLWWCVMQPSLHRESKNVGLGSIKLIKLDRFLSILPSSTAVRIRQSSSSLTGPSPDDWLMKLNMCRWSVATNAAINILQACMDSSLEGTMFDRSSRFSSWDDDHQDLLVNLSYCSGVRTSLENRQSANPLSTSKHSISFDMFCSTKSFNVEPKQWKFGSHSMTMANKELNFVLVLIIWVKVFKNDSWFWCSFWSMLYSSTVKTPLVSRRSINCSGCKYFTNISTASRSISVSEAPGYSSGCSSSKNPSNVVFLLKIKCLQVVKNLGTISNFKMMTMTTMTMTLTSNVGRSGRSSCLQDPLPILLNSKNSGSTVQSTFRILHSAKHRISRKSCLSRSIVCPRISIGFLVDVDVTRHR